MIPAGRLAYLRTVAERDMPDTCSIKEPELVSDGAGGYTTAYVETATTPCRLAPVRSGAGTEAVVAGQVRAIGTHTITLPAGTPLRPSARIGIGDRTFEIVGGTAARSVEITKRVTVTETNPGEGSGEWE